MFDNNWIGTRRACVHCGVNYLKGGDYWCAMCTLDSRHNHGMCTFCKRDVSEFSGCWSVRREMDQARVRSAMPDHTCPSCKDWNDELREMEIVELSTSESMRRLRMVCTYCETVLEQVVRTYRPPPRKKKGYNEEA